jgi:hypothetical protein
MVNNQENPHLSSRDDRLLESFDIPSRERSEWLRFVLHMLITAFLAPCCGGAVYNMFACDWPNTNILDWVVGSFCGSFFLLFFIWFIVIPFGLVSYFVCWGLYSSNRVNKLIRSICGGVTGGLLGLFVERFASESGFQIVCHGSIIGIISGWILAVLWKRPVLEEPQNRYL